MFYRTQFPMCLLVRDSMLSMSVSMSMPYSCCYLTESYPAVILSLLSCVHSFWGWSSPCCYAVPSGTRSKAIVIILSLSFTLVRVCERAVTYIDTTSCLSQMDIWICFIRSVFMAPVFTSYLWNVDCFYYAYFPDLVILLRIFPIHPVISSSWLLAWNFYT